MVPAQMKSTSRGITMIELLIVMGVIGVLSSVLFAFIDPIGQFGKARDANRKNDLDNIQKALELYYNDEGEYPAHTAGTFEISGCLWGATCTMGSPTTYMQRAPGDPSGGTRTYRYERIDTVSGTGQAYRIYAGLERCQNANCQDAQACNPPGSTSPGTACANVTGDCDTVAATSILCTYGVSSTNTRP